MYEIKGTGIKGTGRRRSLKIDESNIKSLIEAKCIAVRKLDYEHSAIIIYDMTKPNSLPIFILDQRKEMYYVSSHSNR